MIETQTWFVGVDWASENHHVRISDSNGKRIGQRVFAHSGAGLTEMADRLTRATGAKPSGIHVAIEVPHGPVIGRALPCNTTAAAGPSTPHSENAVTVMPALFDRLVTGCSMWLAPCSETALRSILHCQAKKELANG